MTVWLPLQRALLIACGLGRVRSAVSGAGAASKQRKRLPRLFLQVWSGSGSGEVGDGASGRQLDLEASAAVSRASFSRRAENARLGARL